MVYLKIDTKPVKGYVIIRDRYSAGAILAEGIAPVETYQTGQWAFYVSFGEVEGYTKPSDDGGKVLSDKILTYTYVAIEPPTNGNGEPPNGEPTPEEPSNLLLTILLSALAAISAIGLVWRSTK